MHPSSRSNSRGAAACILALATCLGLAGCASEPNQEGLPSPYFLSDGAGYFPPGPEFKLSREAAEQRLRRENVVSDEGVQW